MIIGKCQNCPFLGPLTKDHIIPRKFFAILASYGLVRYQDRNLPSNIQLLCTGCNNEKGWKIPKGDRYALHLKNELYRKEEEGTVYVLSRHRRQLGEMFAYH